jgi:hypothetical protein
MYAIFSHCFGLKVSRRGKERTGRPERFAGGAVKRDRAGQGLPVGLPARGHRRLSSPPDQLVVSSE